MAKAAVRAQFLYPDGTPASGTVVFAPRPRILNTASGELFLSTEAFDLDVNGYLGSPAGVQVQVLDDVGVPLGSYYSVTLLLDRSPRISGRLHVLLADVGAGVELAERIQFGDGP